MVGLFDGLTGKSTTDSTLPNTPQQGVDISAPLPQNDGVPAYASNMAKVNTEDQAQQTMSEIEQASLLAPIQTLIHKRYETSRYARRSVESLWLSNMLQWKGTFSSEEQAAIDRSKERNLYSSAIFIKITKTKVTAALGQILDLILDNDEIPIHIESAKYQEADELPNVGFIAPDQFPADTVYGYPGDGQQVSQGATTKSMFGAAYDKFKQVLASKKLIRGASPDGASMPIVTPADDAAQCMEDIIITQMEEGGFKRELRSSIWETCVLGTGIMKGPMTYQNVEHRWEKGDVDPDTGKTKINYVPKTELLPKSYYVSCWNFYPDPSAVRIEDAQYVIEKHLLNKSGLVDLKRVEGFDVKAIDRLIYSGPPVREQEYWEPQIRDVNYAYQDDRYEVLEYWGYLEADMVNTYKLATGEDLIEGQDQFHVNIWICQNEILRLVINPFIPARIPYYPIPYEENTQQIWGTAIPENMRDTQILMNGHYRMMVDNLALAGNCVFEVNENYLSPGQDLTMYPGKVIRTNNGAPGQSIFSLSFKDTSQSHMQAYQLAKQTADEVTGQPSYSYGGASTTGANRTAAGISMLMGAAAGNIRQVVKQCDEYLFHPIGQAYYNWNMQNNDNAVVYGPVEVIAGGTAALMRREVMSQRLLQFAQAVGANPAIAPRVNWNEWVKEFAKSMNLDPDKLLNDATAAMLAAEMMGKAQGGPATQSQGSAPSAPPTGGSAGGAQDQTGGGGGQEGAGMPTTPGESSSSTNVAKA